jgi:hypothetical protein
MKSKLLLLALTLLLFNTYCFADGQSGLGAFILLMYAISICIYTILGGLILMLFFTAFKLKIAKLWRLAFGIAFFISFIVAFILPDKFIPFFW